MFRVTKMSAKVYAVDMGTDYIEDIDSQEQENINSFVSTGTPVILCQELEEAAELFNIEVSEIEIVEV